MDVGLTRECLDFLSPPFQFCDDLLFGASLYRERDVEWTFFSDSLFFQEALNRNRAE